MSFFEPLQVTGVFLIIAAATLGLGAPLARLLKMRETGGARLLWEAAIGFLCGTLILSLVGLVGLLDRRAIVAATCMAAIGGVARLWHVVRNASPALNDDGQGGDLPDWIVYCLMSAAAIAATASFISALVPPTAGDALCYHLELPKRFLNSGSIDFRPDDDNITYPLLAEMGFLWALAFGTPAAAATVQWGCGLLLAGAGYLLGLPYFGRKWSRVAAALVLLVPGVNNQMTVPLNDVAAATYCAFALVAWNSARQQGRAVDYALVGIMVGAALSVKYTAMVFAAALAATWFVAAVEDVGRRRQLLRGAAIALGATLVVGGLWYGRAAWYRGDPLYPFLTKQIAIEGPNAFPDSKTPLGRGPAAIAVAPWSMTMEPERFGGRAHQLGPLFLMFVPAAIAVGSCRSIAAPLTTALFYFLGCVVLRQNVRFLLPLVPILSVATIACWRETLNWSPGARRTVAGVALIVVLFQIAVPVARLRHTHSTLFAGESRVEYLTRCEPTYVAAQWINEHLPQEARLLSQEMRAFYFDPSVIRENIYRRRTHYDDGLESAEAVGPRLRRDGITHVLTAETEGSLVAVYDGTLSRLMNEAVAAGGPAAPHFLNEWRHSDADGITRCYRLFAIE